MERAVVMSGARSKLELTDLPDEIRGLGSSVSYLRRGEVLTMAEIEKRYILEVLSHYSGNRTLTAKALGIGGNTLWRKLKSWGVPPARGDESGPPTIATAVR